MRSIVFLLAAARACGSGQQTTVDVDASSGSGHTNVLSVSGPVTGSISFINQPSGQTGKHVWRSESGTIEITVFTKNVAGPDDVIERVFIGYEDGASMASGNCYSTAMPDVPICDRTSKRIVDAMVGFEFNAQTLSRLGQTPFVITGRLSL